MNDNNKLTLLIYVQIQILLKEERKEKHVKGFNIQTLTKNNKSA